MTLLTGEAQAEATVEAAVETTVEDIVEAAVEAAVEATVERAGRGSGERASADATMLVSARGSADGGWDSTGRAVVIPIGEHAAKPWLAAAAVIAASHLSAAAVRCRSAARKTVCSSAETARVSLSPTHADDDWGGVASGAP